VFSAICAVLLAACGAASAPIDASAQAGSSAGRVTIQIAHSEDTGTTRTQAQAMFVRWRGLTETTVAQLLALPGWGTEEFAIGECRVIDQAQALGDAAGGQRADIQLLDAGNISVKTPDHVQDLVASRYPDVLPTLSGFKYESQADLLEGAEWAVQSGGGEEIGLFAAGTPTPSAVRLMAVGSQEAAPGIAVRRAQDLVVRLDVADGLTYVELATGGADAQIAVRCRAAATGVVRLPAALMGELPAGEATLSAVHATWKPLRGGFGLRRGELWVEYRDELAVGLR
jgi:hypothetical protein